MSKMTLFAVLAGVMLPASVGRADDRVKVDPKGKTDNGGNSLIDLTLTGNNFLDAVNLDVTVTIGNTTYTGNQVFVDKSNTQTPTIKIPGANLNGDQEVKVKVKLNDGSTAETTKTVKFSKRNGLEEDNDDEENSDGSGL